MRSDDRHEIAPVEVSYVESAGALPMKSRETEGAVYVITQDPRYVGLLLTSAASLKRVMPDLPITLFSQFPVQSPLFSRVIAVQPSQDGFYDKVNYLRQTPYERTLFLDADTYIVEPVPELFALLDRFDCAAAHEEYRDTDWFGRYPRPDVPASFPEFNTGVLLLKRSERVQQFLQRWGDLYQEYLRKTGGDPFQDQPFFRAAAYCDDIRIATLTREYNCKFRGQGYLNGTVKILHGHVNHQLTSTHIEAAERALNKSKRPRVYIAGLVYEQKIVGRLVGQRKAHKVSQFPELSESINRMRAKRLRQIVKDRGIKGTLVKLLAALR